MGVLLFVAVYVFIMLVYLYLLNKNKYIRVPWLKNKTGEKKQHGYMTKTRALISWLITLCEIVISTILFMFYYIAPYGSPERLCGMCICAVLLVIALIWDVFNMRKIIQTCEWH